MEQDKLRKKEWSYPRSCPICLEGFSTSAGEPAERGDGGDGGDGDSECGNASRPLLDKQSLDGQSRRKEIKAETNLGDASGSKFSTSTANDNKKPVTLRCGHTFCEPCLQSWLVQGHSCPICRKPVKTTGDAAEDESDSQPGTSSGINRNNQRSRSEMARYGGDNDLTQELMFRLLSLQRLYPTFVSDEQLRILSSDASTTGTLNWELIRDFQMNNPDLRAHRENIGALGNSAAFGGGSGGGGGGAGGSW